jgi:hypothetical protein
MNEKYCWAITQPHSEHLSKGYAETVTRF